MWDTAEPRTSRVTHDLPCPACGHASHTYLPCSDSCGCGRTAMPGEAASDLFLRGGSGMEPRGVVYVGRGGQES